MKRGIQPAAKGPELGKDGVRASRIEEGFETTLQRLIQRVAHGLELYPDWGRDVDGQPGGIQLQEHLSQLCDSPAMSGDGAVPARTPQRDLHLAAPLLGHHDRIEAAAAKMERHATGLADCVLDAREQLGMGLGKPSGPEDSARLLVRQRREDEVAWRSAAGLGAEQSGHHHRDTALHVEGAAAP